VLVLSGVYLPSILMGMGESQLPSQILLSHPIFHNPIPIPNPIPNSKSHPKFQIPSQIPFKSSGRRRTKILPFEPALRDESNGGIPILLQPLKTTLIDEMPSFLSLSILRNLTFR